MKPGHSFTDHTGRVWQVFDFSIVDKERKRRPLGDEKAEARAFVAGADVMVYRFGLIAYRDTTPRNLEQQLAAAKPWAALRGTSLNERPVKVDSV
jgi:hypothetical protein